MRIRVLPFVASDSGFTFTELAAIPEPNALWFAAGGLLLLTAVFRKRR